jgi:preprotein translocase subunit SecB
MSKRQPAMAKSNAFDVESKVHVDSKDIRFSVAILGSTFYLLSKFAEMEMNQWAFFLITISLPLIFFPYMRKSSKYYSFDGKPLQDSSFISM